MELFVDVAQTTVLAMIAVSQIYTLRTMAKQMAEATNSLGRAIGDQSELKRRVRALEDEVAQLSRGRFPPSS